MDDFYEDDTKPHAFSCSQCGASPTQPGKHQIRTALLSLGELDEWHGAVREIADTLEQILDRLQGAPAEVAVSIERLRDEAREIAIRLREISDEIER
jgi:hypothetical protein